MAVNWWSGRPINVGFNSANNYLTSFSFSYGFVEKGTPTNYPLLGTEYDISLTLTPESVGGAPDIVLTGFVQGRNATNEYQYTWTGNQSVRSFQVGTFGVQYLLTFTQPGYGTFSGYLFPGQYSAQRLTTYATNLSYIATTLRTPNVYALSKNTYVHIIGSGITFDSTYVPFTNFVGISGFSTGLVNTVNNVITPIQSTFSSTASNPGLPQAYYGRIPTSTLPIGSTQRFFCIYNGNTYTTGEPLINILETSLEINSSLITPKLVPPGGNALTVSFPSAVYRDSFTPFSTVETIGGRFLGYEPLTFNYYLGPGINSFETSGYAYPTQRYKYRYQTPLAENYQTLFSTVEGYDGEFLLPGITFSPTSVQGLINPSDQIPYYDFNGSLSIFGSKACIAPYLQIRDKTGVDWNFGEFGTEVSDMNSVTYDLIAPELMYNYSYPVPGQTFALPDIYLGLTASGMTAFSPTAGVVRVEFTGVTYGQTYATSLYDGSITIPLIDGSGGYTYTGLFEGALFGYTYQAPSAATYSYNTLSAPVVTVKARPAVVSAPPFTISIQPNNYYFGLRVNPDTGLTLTFNNDGGTTFITDGNFPMEFGINAYNVDPYPNIQLSTFTPTFNPSYGYLTTIVGGGVPSYWTPGELDEFYILYQGETYFTGVTASVPIQPYLNFFPGNVPVPGVVPGTLNINFDGKVIYGDSNYDINGVMVGNQNNTDQGNVVDKAGTIQTGRDLIVPVNLAKPGGFVPVGYQSTSAIAAAALYGGVADYFLSQTVGITLPGITYTNVTTSFNVDGGGPLYEFTNLSVMGITSSSYISNLSLISGTSTSTFPVQYVSSTKSTVQLTGITFDMKFVKLEYSGGGALGSVPDYNLTLGGSVSVARGVTGGTVVATLSGVQYGGSSNLTMRGSAQNERIPIVNGNGSYVYNLTPGQTYEAGYFSYQAVIGLTLTYRALTGFVPYSGNSISSPAAVQATNSLVGTITGTPGVQPGAVTLDFTGITYNSQKSGITLLGALKGELVPITGGTGSYNYTGLTLGFTLNSVNTYFNVQTPAGDPITQIALSAPVVVPSHSLSGVASGTPGITGGTVRVNFTGVTYDSQNSGITLRGNLAGELIPITGGTGTYLYTGLAFGSTFSPSSVFYNVQTPPGDAVSRITLASAVTVPYALFGTATGSPGPAGGTVRVNFTGITFNGQNTGITLVSRPNGELIPIRGGTGTYLYTGLVNGSTFSRNTVYYNVQAPTVDNVSQLRLVADVTVPSNSLFGTAIGLQGTTGGQVRVNFTGVSYNGLSSGITLIGSLNGELIPITGGTGTYLYTGLTPLSVLDDATLYYNVNYPTGDTVSRLSLLEPVVVPVAPAPPPQPVPGIPGQLTLNYLFTPQAGQTYTFNILGESGYTGITASQTINLNVSAAALSRVIAYSGNWISPPGTSGSANTTVYQPQPVVGLMLQEFVGPILDDLTKGLTGVTGAGLSYPAQPNGTIIGTQGTVANTLVKQFQSVTGFTYHAPGVPGVATNYLYNIPQEAITSYNLTNIVTNPLSGVVGNSVDNGNRGNPIPNPSKLGNAIQSLFEQAINMAMVQVTNESNGLTLNNVATTTTGSQTTMEQYFLANSSITAGNAIYGASFTAGQELAIFVQYQLTKTRAYQLTPLADLAYAKGATLLNFGGITFPLAGLVEESSAIPVTYKIVLHAV